jgi:hypothetical protein
VNDQKGSDMVKRRNLPKNIFALIISIIWIWIIWDKLFLDPRWLQYAATSVLYAITIFGIYRFNQAGERLYPAVLPLIALTLGAVMFTFWGATYDMDFPVFPMEWPLAVRTSIFFIHGPLSALLVSTLMFYPLTVLMPRTFWLVPMAVTFYVAQLQFGDLSGGQTLGLSEKVMIYELLCLFLLVPLMVWLMGSRVRMWNKVKSSSKHGNEEAM